MMFPPNSRLSGSEKYTHRGNLWVETDENLGVSAVKKDMLLILDTFSIAQVTGRGGVVVPGLCFHL